MKKYLKLVVMLSGIFGGVFLAAPARAQSAYLGVDVVALVNSLSYSIGSADYKETYGTGHVRVRGGFRINEMFSFEGHALGSKEATERDPFGSDFKMTTGPIAGFYGRFDFPIGEMSSFYGLIGVASVSTKYQLVKPTVGREETDKNTGLSLGFGVAIGLTESLKLNIDYMLYRAGSASYPSYFFGGEPSQVVGGLGAGLSYYF